MNAPPDVNESFSARIEAARRGDTRALEALLLEQLPGLRAFVRLRSGRLLRAKESSSDLVQSVCREVLRDLPAVAVDTENAFRAWLYTSALRKILDRRKYWEAEKRAAAREVSLGGGSVESDGRLLDAYGGVFSPSRHAMVREEIERIERAFEGLPEDYREVLTLARIVGLSHRDVAARMGRSEEAVRQLLSRARARLARLLAPAAG